MAGATLVQSSEQNSVVHYLRFVQQVQNPEAGLVDQLADRLIVEKVNLDPVDSLRHVQILLVLEDVLHIVLQLFVRAKKPIHTTRLRGEDPNKFYTDLLQPFVAVVDGKLFEGVLLQHFEPVEVQQTDGAPSDRTQRAVLLQLQQFVDPGRNQRKKAPVQGPT